MLDLISDVVRYAIGILIILVIGFFVLALGIVIYDAITYAKQAPTEAIFVVVIFVAVLGILHFRT